VAIHSAATLETLVEYTVAASVRRPGPTANEKKKERKRKRADAAAAAGTSAGTSVSDDDE
jgi:hypothetical protein